jgi:hypothetical protein
MRVHLAHVAVEISDHSPNFSDTPRIYTYITRLASNEIFSPSNEIHQEVGRAKDLSAPLYEEKRVVGGFFRAANLAYSEAEFSRKVDGRLVFSHIFY